MIDNLSVYKYFPDKNLFYGEQYMPRTNKTDDIYERISDLPDIEKLKLVDRILIELDKPDPEMDKIWEQEAKRRWSKV